MSERMAPSLWLDVTTLLAHRGKPTGIPRTVASLSQEWLQRHPQRLRFCQLSSESRGYVEVPRELVLAHLAGPQASAGRTVSAGQPPHLVAAGSPGLALEQFLRSACRAWMPAPARSALKKVARRVRPFLQRIAARVQGKMVSNPSSGPPRSAPPCHRFTAEDLLICPGAGWSVPAASEICWHRKRQMGFRTAYVLYDTIPIKFPHCYGPGFSQHYANWMANTLWASDLILAISQHTRRDVLEFAEKYAVPCPPIEVVRLGENLDPSVTSAEPVPQLKGEPFVLSIGTIEFRKNHLLLYHVWRQLVERHGAKVPKLAIVGGLGWAVNDLTYLLQADPAARSRIVVLQDISDAQLCTLYRDCLFTLYPSHYEGWGLPIAESLSFGKYCICSNTSSMPEIGGELVGQHDPSDGKTCRELVERALFDPAYRAGCERRIRRQYRRTSWTDCAGQFEDLIEAHFGNVFHKGDGSADPSTRDVSHSTARAWRAA
jgi:glycosyltransferase involved in cell wall biosynthesis